MLVALLEEVLELEVRSKWSSIACLPRPVMMRMSVSPASTASSTTYWIDGLSTTGSISFGWLLVTGRNRVPSPAAGITALVTVLIAGTLRRSPSAPSAAVVGGVAARRRLRRAGSIRSSSPRTSRRRFEPCRATTSTATAARSATSHHDASGERGRDRERDHHHERRDRRLAGDLRDDDHSTTAAPARTSG